MGQRIALDADRDRAVEWLDSPGHRQNMMRRSYREAGLAIAAGAPQASPLDAGTYAHVFGVHR